MQDLTVVQLGSTVALHQEYSYVEPLSHLPICTLHEFYLDTLVFSSPNTHLRFICLFTFSLGVSVFTVYSRHNKTLSHNTANKQDFSKAPGLSTSYGMIRIDSDNKTIKPQVYFHLSSKSTPALSLQFATVYEHSLCKIQCLVDPKCFFHSPYVSQEDESYFSSFSCLSNQTWNFKSYKAVIHKALNILY